MKKVIIIGAGIGGLSTAARLLNDGYHVEIYEKNSTCGGKTNFIKFKDFKFDLTASLIMFPNDYIEIFNYCLKDYKDYFNMIPLDKLYSVFYYDKNKYDFFTILPELTKTINKITDNNYKDICGYYNFISENYKKYLTAEKTVLKQSFFKTFNLLKSVTIPKAVVFHPLTSSFQGAKKYINNEKLLAYLMFQTMYVGVSPYSSPSIYNIIPAATQIDGLYYIKGGMYSYIEALEKLVLDLGGIIHKCSPVNKILFKRNKAIGIMVNGKNYYSNLVVCSSDYSYTVKNLIKDQYVRKLIKPIDDLEYSCSTFMLYLGLDKKYPNLNIHNIYINNKFKDNINAAFEGKLPMDPSLYIYCPSSIDDTLCPKNYETINVMVRVPNLLGNGITWNEETIYYYQKKVLKILCDIDGLNDILEHIVYINHLTPLDLKNKFNTYGGCAFGLSHKLRQSVIFRPQCQLPRIKSLYFCGASIHPGNGISMVLKSSKICVDKINKNELFNEKKHLPL